MKSIKNFKLVLLWVIFMVLCIAGCGSSSSTSTPHKVIGYAVGTNAILYTEDGKSWKSAVLPELTIERDFTDVCAVDSETAWALGDTKFGGLVYRTLDGGLTWTDVTPKTFSLFLPAQGLKAISKDIAWVVGAVSTVALTTDGGLTWKKFSNMGINTDEPALFTTVAALDTQTVWIVGRDYYNNPLGLYATDGGTSWNRMDVSVMTAKKTLLDISVADKTTVWVSQEGPSKAIYVSTDGGASFNAAYPDESLGDASSIIGLGNHVAFAGFENSSFEMTFDGGRSWSKQTIEGRITITGLTVTETGIWAVGTYPDGDEQAFDGAILHSSNGGISWTKQTPAKTPGLARVSFVGAGK